MIFDLITPVEKEIITYYIEHNVRYNDVTPLRASLKHILSYWETAKEEYLYKIFGGKLILEKDIAFEKDSEQISNDISRLLAGYYNKAYDSDISLFFNELKSLLSYVDNTKCAYYADKEYNNYKHMEFLKLYCNFMGSKYWKDNKYNGSSFIIEYTDIKGQNHKLDFRSGIKLIRMINKVVNAFSDKFTPAAKVGWEKIKLEHSRILNDKTISGKFCLSIHPLDYMTMSDNDCDWHSCMSWRKNGCYRQGTVEMMNSPCVIVAYLKSENDMKIGDFSWNNKKWRELFIVDDKVICNVKGYPYQNEGLTKIVLEWIKELVNENSDFTFYADQEPREFSNTDYYYYYYIDENDNKAYYYDVCFNTCIMYNDFPTTTHYMYLSDEYYKNGGLYECYYSGSYECMICGETDHLFADFDLGYDDPEDYSSYLICPECSGNHVIFCDHCGYYSFDSDDFVYVDGKYLCKDCYHEYYVPCADEYDNISGFCNYHYYSREITPIHLVVDNIITQECVYIHKSPDEIHYNSETDKTLQYLFKQGIFSIKKVWNYPELPVYIIDIEELTERGKEVFGFEVNIAKSRVMSEFRAYYNNRDISEFEFCELVCKDEHDN